MLQPKLSSSFCFIGSYRTVANIKKWSRRWMCLFAAMYFLGFYTPHVRAVEIRTAELFVERFVGTTERYAIATSIFVDSESTVESVSLYSAAYAGSFPLSRQSDGSWWTWAPGRILSLLASFDAIVTDVNGKVVTIPNVASVTPSIPKPLSSGLEMIRIPFGWDIDMDDTGAEFYYAFVYDRVENGASVWSSGHHPSPSLLENLPDAVLIPNRLHTLVPAANFHFDAGPYDNGNSTIRHIGDHLDFISVPEPSGFACLPVVLLWISRQKRGHIYRESLRVR